MSVTLKITSQDGARNEMTTNVNYVNPNTTNATLKEFATELFNLSNNTLLTVNKVVTEDITNAEG